MKDYALLLPLLLPLIGAIVLLAGARSLAVQRVGGVLFSLATFAASLYLLCVVDQAEYLVMQLGEWRAPFGISMVADRLGAVMVAVSSFMGAAVAVYALSEIDEARLLLLEDGHCLKEHALAACNRTELRAEAMMLGTSLHTMVQMVDNGLGVTMLPKIALDAGILDHTRVIARPLDASAPGRTLALVWRRASPRERDFHLLGELLKATANRD